MWRNTENSSPSYVDPQSRGQDHLFSSHSSNDHHQRLSSAAYYTYIFMVSIWYSVHTRTVRRTTICTDQTLTYWMDIWYLYRRATATLTYRQFLSTISGLPDSPHLARILIKKIQAQRTFEYNLSLIFLYVLLLLHCTDVDVDFQN